MKSLYKYILLVFIAGSQLSCTKEISVDVAHSPQTIIFGALTNLNQPVQIIIQQTVPLNSSQTSVPVNDASISLFQKKQSGETSLLTSDFTVNQGTYTSLDNIATTQGYSYWIEVTLSSGTVFKSKEEVMLPEVAITQATQNTSFDDIIDIQFSDPANITNLYKARVRAFNNSTQVSSNFTQSSDVLFNGNTQATIKLDIFPELSEAEEDEINYPDFNSLNIQLANINFESYQFLLNQSAQINANTEANDSESGSPSQLFSTPPVQLIGNITDTSSNMLALGNFSVESISTLTLQL